MVQAPSNLAELVGSEYKQEDAHSLKSLRAAVQEAKDLELEIADLEEQVKTKKAELNGILMQKLPSLFVEAGVPSITIAASGNRPEYTAKLQDYYHASIPEDNRPAAHGWLERNGHGDVIKTTYTIRFGLKEREKALNFQDSLLLKQLDFDSKVQVPWATLTAFVKGECLAGRKDELPLELLGATVGQIVKLTTKKE